MWNHQGYKCQNESENKYKIFYVQRESVNKEMWEKVEVRIKYRNENEIITKNIRKNESKNIIVY